MVVYFLGGAVEDGSEGCVVVAFLFLVVVAETGFVGAMVDSRSGGMNVQGPGFG